LYTKIRIPQRLYCPPLVKICAADARNSRRRKLRKRPSPFRLRRVNLRFRDDRVNGAANAIVNISQPHEPTRRSTSQHARRMPTRTMAAAGE